MTLPPLLAADPPWYAPWMFAAGCALLAYFLLRRAYTKLGRRRSRGGSGPHLAEQPRPATAWDGARADTAARFDREQVELHELGRELQGRLDSKITVLNELVAKSQQQIERLEALLDEREEQEPQIHADER